MHRNILILLLCCSALTVAACSGGNTATPPQQQAGGNSNNQPGAAKTGGVQKADDGIVRASAAEVALRPGGEAEVEVRLDIRDGYHVNANPPTDKNLIGTQVTVAPSGGLSVAETVYPKALMRKFEFDERELAVYEGQPVIKVKLRAEASAPKGRQTLSAKVRVQPCNDKECLPPRNIETAIPVNVD
ncbi:MAG TPA: protein-disulfide reductase DsbD domain-containing protein [Pyrinomonadaceae bacterium]|nr:protein-disulfide reductase DsbD domain-containing protein [Pyrinomonadaceae bacterium]